MIICNKCGTDNQLGRVFCGKCGTKLDLRDMSSDKVLENIEVSWWALHGKKILVALLILVVVPLALAFWPKFEVIGKPGRAGSEGAIATRVRQIIPSKAKFTYEFIEDDINGYFAAGRAKALGFESLSVELNPASMRVRAIKPLFVLPVGSKQFTPPASYELICAPGPTEGLVVVSASMGHVPLAGPLKSIAVNAIVKSLMADKDFAAKLNAPGLVKPDTGKISVVY